ncbi:uncharacterized protein CTRU02_212831 [Colletotrichum truncatum]|uniref:Uncharacterized protein n=1 Tax=Colletotrichum truncatum TaxID=5467 RepID=A0ACC3YIZ1_COLTU|nr:uncharacterized protein CTRU02_03153 [Colletotrichum truncatum]KAF6797122.1 hypothetical protein CTRU02_03153 [Colletotrichum truncatum]
MMSLLTSKRASPHLVPSCPRKQIRRKGYCSMADYCAVPQVYWKLIMSTPVVLAKTWSWSGASADEILAHGL